MDFHTLGGGDCSTRAEHKRPAADCLRVMQNICKKKVCRNPKPLPRSHSFIMNVVSVCGFLLNEFSIFV